MKIAVLKEGKQVATFTNIVERDGVIGRIMKKGAGKKEVKYHANIGGDFDEEEIYERYDEYFDTFLMCGEKLNAAGYTNKDVNDTPLEDRFTKFGEYALQMGENPGGVEVINLSEKEEQEFLENKKATFSVHQCWETGIKFYQLIGKYHLPKEVFSSLGLRYHSEQQEDMEEGNWKGWYNNSKKEIIEGLSKHGWTSNL